MPTFGDGIVAPEEVATAADAMQEVVEMVGVNYVTRDFGEMLGIGPFTIAVSSLDFGVAPKSCDLTNSRLLSRLDKSTWSDRSVVYRQRCDVVVV